MKYFFEKSDFQNSSWHSVSVRATYNELVAIVGEPVEENRDEDEKVQCDWELNIVYDGGDKRYFTIYDWKEYRDFGDDEMIDWHIGGQTRIDTEIAAKGLKESLEELREEKKKKYIYVVAMDYTDDGIPDIAMGDVFQNEDDAKKFAKEWFEEEISSGKYGLFTREELEVEEDELYCHIPTDDYEVRVQVFKKELK